MADLTATPPATRPRLTPVWVGLALLVETVWFFANRLQWGRGSAFIVGQALAPALGVGLVLYLTVLRRARPWVAMVSLALVVGWCAVFYGGAMALGTGVHAHDAEMAPELAVFRARIRADAASIQARADAIGGIVDGARLRSPADIPAARERLRQRRLLQDELRQTLARDMAQERARVAQRWPSELTEFDAGAANSEASLQRMAETDTRQATAAGQMLDLLQRSAGRWHVEGDAFAFDTTEDRAEFHRLNLLLD